MSRRTPALALLVLPSLLVACRSGPVALDPGAAPVMLDAPGPFEARLLYNAGCGVWTAEVGELLSRYGGPEIVAVDDLGRAHVLFDYSGRAIRFTSVHDGSWLGGVAIGDADPTIEGPELYVGAERGNLYQVLHHVQGGASARVVHWFAGREVHSLSVFEGELYAGLSDGDLLRVSPPESAGGPWWQPWETQLVFRAAGRVRQMIPIEVAGEPRLAYVSRSGRAALLRRAAPQAELELDRVLLDVGGGLARITAGPTRENAAPILYMIADAGAVLRVSRQADGSWQHERIYRGPLGGRGIAAGTFDPDGAESVAIFGYSGRVELLTREPSGSWSAELLFDEGDKGHWLAAGELDPRNDTTELVLCGYSGRVIQLSRPPVSTR